MKSKNAAKSQTIEGLTHLTCPVTFALKLIGGKWNMPILYILRIESPLRYNELRRRLDGITNMMLSQSLKELEASGLITRTQYPEIPPRVEYAITESGLALKKVIDELAIWGQAQMDSLVQPD